MGTQASVGHPPSPLCPASLSHAPSPHFYLGTLPRVVFICLLTQPKKASTLHTCIKEIKCYF
uniref:Uncharacterized protein n=1 Tax=Bos mutus grunniens TaxID=30521 RepID=A0A8C0AK92_BOSMU